MTELITASQARVLERLWSRLHARGDPRATLSPAHRRFSATEQRLRWAHMKLGGLRREAWSGLTQGEARYLRQLLTETRTALDAALEAQFVRLKIADPVAYFEAIKSSARQSKILWTYGGRDFHELNRLDKLHLLRRLKART
jgi:hypothetical protein